MKIRRCEKEDVKSAGEFYDAVVRALDEGINYPIWTYKVYPSEESVRARMEKGEQYLCLSGEKIIGAFVLNEELLNEYRPKATADAPYKVLHTLATDPTLRNRGLASEIITFCAKTARKERRKAIFAEIIPTNLPAKRLFEKSGFVSLGEVSPDPKIEGIDRFTLLKFSL